jgi:peptidoglycan/xylan/chitin deacetylase (PgdA/CDA1 family)
MIAITFDDAFENVFENAVPILKQYQLRAAICVPTGYIGKTAGWSMSSECDSKDEAVMTREQISLLDQQGFEVYSHTVSHYPLATQDMKVVQYELEQSKAVLEDIVGHDVVSISYPYGSINQSVL